MIKGESIRVFTRLITEIAKNAPRGKHKLS